MKNPIKLKISLKKANTNIHHSGGWLVMHSHHCSTSVGPCEELSFHLQTKAHWEHIPESLICKLKKVHLFNNYFAINH